MVNLSSWNTVKSFSGMSSAGGDSKEKVWRTITQEASIDIQGDFFFLPHPLSLSLKTLI